VQDIIAENVRLKERLVMMEGSANGNGNRDGNRDVREVRQENEKLKKRVAIMKKRNEEVESMRKEEIEIMMAVFDNIISNSPNPTSNTNNSRR